MRKILAVILLIIFLIFAGGVYKYGSLIKPVLTSQGKTAEVIQQQQAESSRELAKSLEKEGVADAALIKAPMAPMGTMQETTTPVDTASIDLQALTEEKATENPKAVHSKERIISEHLKRIETFKSDYALEISRLMQAAKNEYHNLPAAEKKPDAVLGIGFKYADRAVAMEADADARFQSILSNLEKELSAVNAAVTVVDDMKNYYQNFKETQKQYYFAEIKAASKK